MFNNPFHNLSPEDKNKREQLNRLLRVSAPHERLALAGIGLIVLAFAAWAIFGSVARTVTLDGVLIEPGERRAAFTAEPGQLLEFLVAPGDRVRAGQAVARQNVPGLERETTALRERVSLLRSQLGQAGRTGGTLRPLLDSAEAALLQMEVRRAAGQTIVSPIAGEVAALSSAPGTYLPAGAVVARIRETQDRPPEAVLRVDRSTALRIRPGMAASVAFGSPGGETSRLNGTVARVVAGPLPDWLAQIEPAVPVASHRIDITLRNLSDLSAVDGAVIRARIRLGRHSPAALLARLGSF